VAVNRPSETQTLRAVERTGAIKDPWPSDDTLRSLRGRGAGRAALVDFRPPYGIRDLAHRAGVPLGSLSRVLDLLPREGLVTRDVSGAVTAIDWERTIRRWAQDYDFARSNQIAYYLEASRRPSTPAAGSAPMASTSTLWCPRSWPALAHPARASVRTASERRVVPRVSKPGAGRIPWGHRVRQRRDVARRCPSPEAFVLRGAAHAKGLANRLPRNPYSTLYSTSIPPAMWSFTWQW
jgi:hypothetical protein